ncbi:phage holin family protein [Actinomadura craniellae]|uniref:Phage holin family protein n=1 Tax=Actinomadura craniellae TaxID=2231787 RepID=A0A365H718_9ACTN|nr:phage holin family protein [Actinomadura craniellae]RAY14839.1 phage holin family protein [Actinomadura craniellae]
MTQVGPGERIEDKSIGELVALASGNVAKLVKTEIDLARAEITADAKKAALGSAMFSLAGLLGALVVIMLSISLAFGLVELGMWPWAAFLTIGVGYTALAGGLVFFGQRKMRKISGAPRTRKTVRGDLAAFRRSPKPAITE